MIVIWRGAGGLVLLIPIVACLIMNFGTAKAFNETTYFQDNLWPKVAALWLTGIVTWIVGKYLNNRPEQVVIDGPTGEEVKRRLRHDFMFIKVEYWGVISVAIGIGLIVTRLIS